MKPRSLFALVPLIALLVAAHSQDYEIRLVRPHKVGDQVRMHAEGSDVQSFDSTLGEERVPTEKTEYSVVLDALMTVARVNNDGLPQEYSYEIETFTRTSDGKTVEVLPKGSVVTQSRGKPGASLVLSDGELSRIARESLTLVLGSKSDQDDPDDRVFGTDTRQKVGDVWPIDKKAALEEWLKQGLSLTEQNLNGEVKLANTRSVDGVECIEIVGTMQIVGAIPGMSRLPEGIKWDSRETRVTFGGLFPVDVAKPELEEHMTVQIEARMSGPVGQRQVPSTTHLKGTRSIRIRFTPAS